MGEPPDDPDADPHAPSWERLPPVTAPKDGLFGTVPGSIVVGILLAGSGLLLFYGLCSALKPGHM